MAHLPLDLERILGGGAIAVLRAESAAMLRQAALAVARGGIRSIEVTMTVPDALGVLAELRRDVSEEVALGMGTVLDAQTAEQAMARGAEFVVTPVFRPGVIPVCKERGVPVMVGALTPTEILAAHEAGADLVKVFPASLGGPKYLRELRGPFPDLLLVPTGGVTPENAGDYLRAGAVAVGVGGALAPREALQAGDFRAIEEMAKRLMETVAGARGEGRWA